MGVVQTAAAVVLLSAEAGNVQGRAWQNSSSAAPGLPSYSYHSPQAQALAAEATTVDSSKHMALQADLGSSKEPAVQG